MRRTDCHSCHVMCCSLVGLTVRSTRILASSAHAERVQQKQSDDAGEWYRTPESAFGQYATCRLDPTYGVYTSPYILTEHSRVKCWQLSLNLFHLAPGSNSNSRDVGHAKPIELQSSPQQISSARRWARCPLCQLRQAGRGLSPRSNAGRLGPSV